MIRHIKRAYLSVIRRKKSTALILSLFIIILVLVNLSSLVKEMTFKSSIITKEQMNPIVYLQPKLGKQNALTKEMYEKLKNISGIKNVSVTASSFVRTSLKSVGVKDSDLKLSFNEMEEPVTNYVYGINSLNDDDNFKSKKFKIVSGKLPTGSENNNPILVSKKYAELNNLKINDKIIAWGGEKTGTKKIEYQISGIFDTKEKKVLSNEVSSFMNPENNFYTSINSIENTKKLEDKNQTLTFKFIKLTIDNIDKTKQVINNIKKIKEINWKNVDIKSDYKQYKDTKLSLEKIIFIINIILVASITIGAIILCIVMIVVLSDRKYEIGVLLSLGESKKGVVVQIITEVFVTFIVAFILAITISGITSKNIGNNLIQQNTSNITKNYSQERNTELLDGYHPSEVKVTNHDLLSNGKILKIGCQTLLEGILLMLIALSIPLSIILRKDPKNIF